VNRTEQNKTKHKICGLAVVVVVVVVVIIIF
jgi:hypothetical protein